MYNTHTHTHSCIQKIHFYHFMHSLRIKPMTMFDCLSYRNAQLLLSFFIILYTTIHFVFLMSPVSPDTEQHLSCPPPAAVQSALNQPQKPGKQPCSWVNHPQSLSWKRRTGAGRPARWETGGRSGTGQAGRSAAGQCGSAGTHAAAHRGTSLPLGRRVWDPAGKLTSPAPTPYWEHVWLTFWAK